MKKELLKNYISKLTKQDIINYLSKECIPASNEEIDMIYNAIKNDYCLLYTSPSPRDRQKSRMPSSA